MVYPSRFFVIVHKAYVFSWRYIRNPILQEKSSYFFFANSCRFGLFLNDFIYSVFNYYNPLAHEFHLSNLCSISSCRTGNTLHFRYKRQPINSA